MRLSPSDLNSVWAEILESATATYYRELIYIIDGKDPEDEILASIRAINAGSDVPTLILLITTFVHEKSNLPFSNEAGVDTKIHRDWTDLLREALRVLRELSGISKAHTTVAQSLEVGNPKRALLHREELLVLDALGRQVYVAIFRIENAVRASRQQSRLLE